MRRRDRPLLADCRLLHRYVSEYLNDRFQRKLPFDLDQIAHRRCGRVSTTTIDDPDKMVSAAFLVTLRRRARAVSPVRDALAEARRFLDASGETREGQALRKVIETLATGTGDFDESEVWLFSAETLALAAALVEARLQGLYPDGDWRRKHRETAK